jgi:two-component system response regulator FlrC
MLEATLFGYEKGSFTGAYQSCPGKFELAQDGTILLDEISEMELVLQAKILRVLQEREVERIGGKKTISLNVRVIATSNRDLKKEVDEGRFREDLFYRLNVFPLRIPRLSERKGDISELVKYMISKWSHINNCNVDTISDNALKIIENYSWPGNIRELDNVIQRAIILTDDNVINENDLCIDNHIHESHNNDDIGVDEEPDADKNDHIDIKGHEYSLIKEVLESVSWSRKKAASKLGISERTLRYKLSKMRDIGYSIQARQ